MELSNLKPAAGSIKTRKRIGRGQGSGRGGTSTKGHKGAQSRAGFSTKRGFEGGQMPLKLRVPKFGFKNHNRVEYNAVNLDVLQEMATNYKVELVDPAFLAAHGLIGNASKKVKILGRGELTVKLTVKAHAFSASAKQIIEAAGGVAEVI
ncbi:MAG: 50S ribosomal protein L15 [Sphingobacteriaceae bacterium]|nr:50S ribosomal protein L15 [Sphingobacteriaceae bacterium]